MRGLRTVVLATCTVAMIAACAGSGSDSDAVTVFAAASLTDAFGELATAFEAANPGVDVAMNFAGSSSLREQILSGAPADVFASANSSNMEALVEADEVRRPVNFATNGLQIVVPVGNPGGVDGLADFADDELLIGLCARPVPCGQFARQVLDDAGVAASVDTEEPDVRAVLTKVEAGELDAGLVYVSDVVAAGDRVEGIELPSGQNVRADYPIAVVDRSEVADRAVAFVEFVLGVDGQAILQRHGFGPP